MANSNGKFLVSLLGDVSHRQILFLVWSAIVGVFVLLMIGYYKKVTRRNFRDDSATTNHTALKLEKHKKGDLVKKD